MIHIDGANVLEGVFSTEEKNFSAEGHCLCICSFRGEVGQLGPSFALKGEHFTFCEDVTIFTSASKQVDVFVEHAYGKMMFFACHFGKLYCFVGACVVEIGSSGRFLP